MWLYFEKIIDFTRTEQYITRVLLLTRVYNAQTVVPAAFSAEESDWESGFVSDGLFQRALSSFLSPPATYLDNKREQ